MYLPKLGNIKIGGLERGLPKMFDKIKVTLSGKGGSENFIPHPKYPKPLSALEVMLPLGVKSFDVAKISFLRIEGHLFLAKAVRSKVFLFPLEANRNDPLKPFPVFLYGLEEECADALDLRVRGILYALPLDCEAVGAFHFKTESLNSITEIQNAIEEVMGFDPGIENTVFRLEINTKLIDPSKNREVSYLRMVPLFKEVKYSPKILALREAIERSEADAILSFEDFKKASAEYFGITAPRIEVENEFEFEGEYFSGETAPATHRKKRKAIRKLERSIEVSSSVKDRSQEEESGKSVNEVKESVRKDAAEKTISGKEDTGAGNEKRSSEGKGEIQVSSESGETIPPEVQDGPVSGGSQPETAPSLFPENKEPEAAEKEEESEEGVLRDMSLKFSIPLKVLKSLRRYVSLEEAKKIVEEAEGNTVKIIRKITEFTEKEGS